MVKALKKTAVFALAFMLLLGTFMSVAAATSPSSGKVPVDNSSVTVNSRTYSTKKNGEAHFKSTKSSSETITIPATEKIKRVKYKVVSIGSNAFKGSKVKTVILKGPLTVKKNAFYKSKVKVLKISTKKYKFKFKKGSLKGIKKIIVTKKMSDKNFAKLKKALKKAGYKGKIVRK